MKKQEKPKRKVGRPAAGAEPITTYISFKATATFKKRLDKYCSECDVTKGLVIREAVETYLDNKENCNSSGEPPDA